MRVKVTLTKIRQAGIPDSTVSGDYFIEGSNLEFFAEGTLLTVYNPDIKRSYVTDFTFSGVDAVLAAAPVTGGHFVLT